MLQAFHQQHSGRRNGEQADVLSRLSNEDYGSVSNVDRAFEDVGSGNLKLRGVFRLHFNGKLLHWPSREWLADCHIILAKAQTRPNACDRAASSNTTPNLLFREIHVITHMGDVNTSAIPHRPDAKYLSTILSESGSLSIWEKVAGWESRVLM